MQLVRMSYVIELKCGKSKVVGSVKLVGLVLSDNLLKVLTINEVPD